MFEPIAIVGRGCVLPGALHPAALWDNVLAGRDLLSAAPDGRWRLSRERALASGQGGARDVRDAKDRAWSDRGGYVAGFDEHFRSVLARDPFPRRSGPPESLLALDPLFQWVLYAGREALREAGHEGRSDRAGAVLGNLSFPSSAMSAWAEATWLGDLAGVARPDPRNRFMSGLPAHLLADALGLGAGAFALDAACASSLYAIALACERLQDREVDRMLAGAVCRSDDLFMHIGFCALSALSRTGRSRPFSSAADGLVPAEGAAFVVLERLSDAEAAQRPILGVIRGVGLSNDGRGRGLLAPAVEGQLRAMRAAYAMAGVDPGEISLLECHATGTPLGDATEIATLTEVFGRREVPLGSLKSNLGHLVTTAGAAGLLKLLGAMAAGIRPPTLHADPLSDAVAASPFRVLQRAEPWEGRRLAGLSAFGFGGNNAHLLVEAYERAAPKGRAAPAAPAARPAPAGHLAVVAMGVCVGELSGVRAFAEPLLSGGGADPRRATVALPADRLRFPPRDLEQALAQQTLLLEAAIEATDGLALPRDRTAVLIGMGADTEVCRYMARWRLAESAPARLGPSVDVDALKDAIIAPLRAAGVVGNMPNIPANRLNSHLDVGGPSFTIAAEELSGPWALRVASRALRAGAVDAAIVGAVDLSCEPAHAAALEALGVHLPPGDAAVVLVLERLDDAVRERHPVLAVIVDEPAEPGLVLSATDLAPRFGHAHAASGLLHVAAAVLACRHAQKPDGSPWSDDVRVAEVRCAGLGGGSLSVRIGAGGPAAPLPPPRSSAGPALTLPAHPPAIVVPGAAPRSSPGDSMEPAPPLPSAFDDLPPLYPGPTGFSAADAASPPSWDEPPPMAPALVEAAAADIAVEPLQVAPAFVEAAADTAVEPLQVAPAFVEAAAVDIPGDVIAGAAAFTVQMAQIHKAWAEQQAQVHRRFLQMRQRALDALVEASSGAAAAVHAAPSAQVVPVAWVRVEAPRPFEAPRPIRAEAPRPIRAEAPRPIRAEAPRPIRAEAPRPIRAEAPAAPPPPPRPAAAAPPPSPRPAAAAPPPSPRPAAAAPPPSPRPAAAAPPPSPRPAAAAPPPSPRPAAAAPPPSPRPAAAAPPPSPRPAAAAPPPSPRPAAAPDLPAAAALAPRGPRFSRPAAAAPPPSPRPAAAAPPPSPRPAAAPDLPAAAALAPRGPRFSREQLEHLASGRISDVFGPLFARQDGYRRQVRMPMPPLLLADRVTGIDAEPGSMKLGTMWTETDVRWDSWYLHDGAMPAGIMIESGQADLLLISWLGADFENKGERVYRLLGCEITFYGGLPRPGDTLVYDIHVDGHAKHGDVRLFFFHYDCRIGGELRLKTRKGQAGFFTDEELANSGGVLWDADSAEHAATARLDPPRIACQKSAFDRADLLAFAAGDGAAAFGPGFERLSTHVRTPRISAPPMLFFDRVDAFDPAGGPWKRGYLRATLPITKDGWYFEGHFKDDPCMPGTLMFEGCFQALAFYMAAMGFTVDADGFRFEPVPEIPYLLRCRGQVVPTSRLLTYEVFVEEVHDGPQPTVFADFLCTVDGLKAFHARRVGLRLRPDWPLSSSPELLDGHVEPKPVARVPGSELGAPPAGGAAADAGGFPFDYKSLLSCAWGRPSDAFGPLYRRFDEGRHVARLPGPPYHFMSRVLSVSSPMAAMKAGAKVEVEYDVPADAWYFDENASLTMPFAVVLEAALQTCGWLASYAGCALSSEGALYFRNLDGKGTLRAEVLPDAGALRTTSQLTNISRSGGMIILAFRVECSVGATRVYDLETVFGFFPKAALATQIGIPPKPEEVAALDAPSEFEVDLRARPERYCGGELGLARPSLLMIDRIDGLWQGGGRKGLGRLRARRDVQPSEWFFKAHFLGDPVQPGSLGIEAMLQTIQFWMLHHDLHAGLRDPRFEPVMTGHEHSWRYRGQVLPSSRRVTVETDILEVGRDDRGPYVVAESYLWVDGLRIYGATLGVRIVDGAPPPRPRRDVGFDPRGDARHLASLPGAVLRSQGSRPNEPAAGRVASPEAEGRSPQALARRAAPPEAEDAEEVLDPAGWVADHCPTWTVPALPGMSMVDRLAGAALRARPGSVVVAVEDVVVLRWLTVPGPVRIKAEATGTGDVLDVRLLAWREASNPALSRFEPVCTGRVRVAGAYPPAPAPEPALDAPEADDPYAAGTLFHGPAFQYLTSLRLGDRGSSAVLDPGKGSVPPGALHQGMLDALTHTIPHDRLFLWDPASPPAHIAFPSRIPSLRLYGPIPEAPVRVEVRYEGRDDRFVSFRVQVIAGAGAGAEAAGERVWLELRLVEVLLPQGSVGGAPPGIRRAFLRDRAPVDLGVSRVDAASGEARCSPADVRTMDWMPGTVAHLYAASGDLVEAVAVKDHVARRAGVHPSTVSLAGVSSAQPLTRWPFAVAREGSEVVVRDAGPPAIDIAQVRRYWGAAMGLGRWPAEDLYFGLIERFIRRVHVADPAAFRAVKGRSLLYLGNHQVAVESLLFGIAVSGLTEVSTVTLAKAEHRTTWLGTMLAHCFAYPGARDPKVITYFDREDKASLGGIIAELGAEMQGSGKGVMVHVEGTRSLECRTPVQKMSGAFIDMALAVGVPVVPVRFAGALPPEPLEKRLEFPLGMGVQDIWIGRPLLPEELAGLTYKERKDLVIAGINGLGPSNEVEQPFPGDPAFAASVDAWVAEAGVGHEDATVFRVLEACADPTPETAAIVEAARTGRLAPPDPRRADWLRKLAARLLGRRLVG
ncbi:beta-ketoacyl synthase N-terminal-like domain-containing protein [Sorangium cellulosum]|uniref:beta-ketoacyl synthase N-terminal-like domain-containing protein n=1 Tax=Sorangium cellulosum TaxID=56 RepID=UPI001F16D9DA|nr:beta-ketoacyl synthase N-terminal-like domain-containing protein [Sorangium cellulosum]